MSETSSESVRNYDCEPPPYISIEDYSEKEPLNRSKLETPDIVVVRCDDKTVVDLGTKDATTATIPAQPLLASSGPHGAGILRKEQRKRNGAFGFVKKWLLRPVGLCVLLFMFICSLDLLSSAFRLLGGKTAGEAFKNSDLLNNPVTGLMVGILATALLQSSSTTTSILVTMTASGILSVRPAIPMIMGANVGTSVTNTIVSLTQITNRQIFERAFAGATVHDMFNWLTVIVLLPTEILTGYLFKTSEAMVDAIFKHKVDFQCSSCLLQKMTKPVTSFIIKLDKNVIKKIALGSEEALTESMIKKYCKFEEVVQEMNTTLLKNVTTDSGEFVAKNVTPVQNIASKVPVEKCHALFSYIDFSDTIVGVILLVFALIVLCGSLVLVVKLLKSMLKHCAESTILKGINMKESGILEYFTGYAALLIGALITFLVQSSSVFTSLLTPLVGLNLIRLESMYPMTLGSNIGTTTTGMFAALAAPPEKMREAVQIALCHLMFNLTGILLFYPVPFMRWPILLARLLGRKTAKYPWVAVMYLLVMFFLLPACVFSLSMLGSTALLVGISLFAAVFIPVTILNILQAKKRHWLPKKLQNWDYLPKPLHSLKPYDQVIQLLLSVCGCCRKCQTGSKCDYESVATLSTASSTPLSSLNSTRANTPGITPWSSSSNLVGKQQNSGENKNKNIIYTGSKNTSLSLPISCRLHPEGGACQCSNLNSAVV